MAGSEDPNQLIQSLINIVNDIALIGDYIKFHRKECTNLARRVKLLAPLFEEVREIKDLSGSEAVGCLRSLVAPLENARLLLRECQNCSKIYAVFKRDALSSKFQSITTALVQALDQLCYDHLDLSEEVKEQVELVHAQLKRAKGRAESLDISDLVSLFAEEDGLDMDRDALVKLAGKLELTNVAELKQESQALESMAKKNSSDLDGPAAEKMLLLLAKVKEIFHPEASDIDNEKLVAGGCNTEKQSSPVIPDDFRCPISLDMMKDPVIVATGQTYERACIQKWIDAGHKTCPKTQQVLPHLSLTPNYVLRSLIRQWCESNGIELPKIVGPSRPGKSTGHCTELSPGEKLLVSALLERLSSGQIDEQRAAAGELRQLAKRSIENRVCIAESGGIPLLVGLLSTTDLKTQEHAVTALLNLSIHDQNKGLIVLAGAIDPIVEVLKSGSMEARENAAATLFSLSVVDENKITIGASGAIPALVELLREGSLRGRKDAATALFNLSIYQGNKARAVRAGIIEPLMTLLVDSSTGMVDEALAILAILITHHEARIALGNTSPVPILVELISSGLPRSRENAAAILLSLSLSDSAHIIAACQLGAHLPLCDLARNGTSRARRKASALLEHINKQELIAEICV